MFAAFQTLLAAFLAVLLAICAASARKLRHRILSARSRNSALWMLPGPPSASWLFGNLKQLNETQEDRILDQWAEEYGPVVRISGFLNSPIVFPTDTRAINHVLMHCAEYPKPHSSRRELEKALGPGLLCSEGDQYRRQRKVMNPAFGPAQVREYAGLFIDKAIELRNLWAEQDTVTSQPTRLNVLKGLNMMTLDVMGIAGFNHDFEIMGSHRKAKSNELTEACDAVFNLPNRTPVLLFFNRLIPVFGLYLDETLRRVEHSKSVIRRIGARLVKAKKADLQREATKDAESGGQGRRSPQGRDMLSLLVKANVAADLPNNPRLSDEDVLSRTSSIPVHIQTVADSSLAVLLVIEFPTFLLTGHETTSSATAWCLYALSQTPDVQHKLRSELLSVETDRPTMDELAALPYLDMVVRETLRLHAPVASTMRVATRDDVIPLNKPFVGQDGVEYHSIVVSAGCPIIIPILTLHRSKAIWGEDAYEFKPERWQDPPAAISSLPGVWGHLMTFGGGPRACIGYRFSLVEYVSALPVVANTEMLTQMDRMRALIFTLVRAFAFAPAIDPSELRTRPGIVLRPFLAGAPNEGSQIPLMVTRYPDW
ncbi:Phylloquinone omega-hydroxylase CYP4F2 [Trametes pubescens]|uniref:Phylloquinone omega-hydroxylase CYP4F2 n=1 Tax=Trametes pubescens TaxID=154538 RepID=A0A1M2W1V1_TRAPU|nr:Phylloquinone omega-hydroxylase CYP4F2 [Trametes pubescens]